VDRPDDVQVVSTGTVLRLSVHETDLGKVIGKQGCIARSLRILLLAMSVGAKNNIALDIVSARAAGSA
jgi:predicted RNA-binding protein YlqC (UPF0109 family)